MIPWLGATPDVVSSFAAPEPTPATPAAAMSATETVLQATEDAIVRERIVALKPRLVCGICGREDCGSADRWDREVT